MATVTTCTRFAAPLIGFALLVSALLTTAAPSHQQDPSSLALSDAMRREFYGQIREVLMQNMRLAADARSYDETAEENLDQLVPHAPPSPVDHEPTDAPSPTVAPTVVVVPPTGAAAEPAAADKPLKPRVLANWPPTELRVGQISAVAVNIYGNPVIFHRGERVWDENSFNDTEQFQQPDAPIEAATILTLDARTGRTLAAHGADQFYMPHGLTIDRHDHLWLTDVALHQVFKFDSTSAVDEQRPSLVLGERFRPGSAATQLCKPTAVAVAQTGEFFVADGYCNARILKFNAAGRLLRIIPQPPDEFLSLNVPHGLALLDQLDLLCIADRENSQVVCPRAGLRSSRGEGQPAATVQEPDLGRVFAVAACGPFVYAVNGPTAAHIPVRGFTIDPRTEQIVDHWGEGFANPHSVAFAPNATAMYVAETGPNRLWKFEMV